MKDDAALMFDRIKIMLMRNDVVGCNNEGFDDEMVFLVFVASPDTGLR